MRAITKAWNHKSLSATMNKVHLSSTTPWQLGRKTSDGNNRKSQICSVCAVVCEYETFFGEGTYSRGVEHNMKSVAYVSETLETACSSPHACCTIQCWEGVCVVQVLCAALHFVSWRRTKHRTEVVRMEPKHEGRAGPHFRGAVL